LNTTCPQNHGAGVPTAFTPNTLLAVWFGENHAPASGTTWPRPCQNTFQPRNNAPGVDYQAKIERNTVTVALTLQT
jgi:hypothetical protein